MAVFTHRTTQPDNDMNALQLMAALQKATAAARERTADKTISTQTKDGKVQVTRVTYDAKGKSTVSPVSEWLDAADAVAYLDRM